MLRLWIGYIVIVSVTLSIPFPQYNFLIFCVISFGYFIATLPALIAERRTHNNRAVFWGCMCLLLYFGKISSSSVSLYIIGWIWWLFLLVYSIKLNPVPQDTKKKTKKKKIKTFDDDEW